MGAEPALPPQGQRMEGIAHTALEEVTKEQLCHDAAINQIQPAHERDTVAHILQPVVGEAAVGHADQRQQHQNQAGTPGRCEPGEIFLKDGFIKE